MHHVLGDEGEGQGGVYHVLGEVREGQESGGVYEIPIQSVSKESAGRGVLQSPAQLNTLYEHKRLFFSVFIVSNVMVLFTSCMP